MSLQSLASTLQNVFKKQKFLLGIADPKMGQDIFNETGITASYNESIAELQRGLRTHFVKIMKSK